MPTPWDELAPLLEEGDAVALATVVAVERSAPRPPGTAMAVTRSGAVVGSVSGGCVEGALYEEAMDLLEKEGPPRLLGYGISDDDAFAVGLSCGGTLHVFLERVAPWRALVPELLRQVAAEVPVALATVVEGPGAGEKVLVGEDTVSGPGTLPETLLAEVRRRLRAGENALLEAEGRRVFVQSFVPTPRMYVFGAIDLAQAMVRLGKFLGFRVSVCDARSAFLTPERFAEADEVVVAWPHEWLSSVPVSPRDVLCVLTHDAKFDVPLLEVALKTPAAYIGVLGSRRTHAKRVEELRRRGVSEESLDRIAAPAGLDIGGRSAAEIALAIAAEITALRHGRPGGRMKRSGPSEVSVANA